jgi:UDP-N-acetylmuramyl pentapeptide phosphotransferase/UDP-N-acetylglucosamine-1-phosphate transferase
VAGLIAESQAEESVLWIVVGAVCIAAWANVGNLFDLGPGRCIKVCWPISATLTLVFLDSLVPLALALGSVLGVLGSDLKEKVMLGDTGANPLGALVGVCFLATGNHAVVVGGCLVGIALNLAAEKVSFSRIIVSNSLLLRLDSLGATEARRVYLRIPRQ